MARKKKAKTKDTAAKATTMSHIKRHHLEDAKCVIPSRDLLSKVDETFSAFIDRSVTPNIENRTLAPLRDTLLPKLISGEIRVKDAEKFVGASA